MVNGKVRGRKGDNRTIRNPTESELMRQIVDGLRWHGYRVLHAGQGRRAVRCPTCGTLHHQRGYIGNSPGLPDILVSIPRCGKTALWLGIELKRDERQRLRPEQMELHEEGRIVVCWSLEQALDAINKAEEGLRRTDGERERP